MNKIKIQTIAYLSIIIIGAALCKAAPLNAADPQKLIGKWRRIDNNYVIDIYKIDKNGQLDAGYYNPNPINVNRALFIQDSNKLKVFIELVDEGYPGSAYTLNYDPEEDALVGNYFHAGMNRNYNVMFLQINK